MTTLSSDTISTDRGPSRTWIKVLAVTLAFALVAFITSPNAPLGHFWAPAMDMPMPTATQLPLFIVLNAAETLTFGLGVAFLVFGFPALRAIAPASPALTRAAHLSIAWLLINWWPHDSLHVHNGMELGGLLVIEYVFHLTLMISGVVLAWFFLTLQRRAA